MPKKKHVNSINEKAYDKNIQRYQRDQATQ